VKVFDRVQLDTKEVDAENDTVLKGARLRIFLGKKILTVAIKVTLNYPEEPIKFTYGSMQNIKVAHAQHCIQNANRLAEEKSREQVPHLRTCLESIKEYIVED
jgi:hypothetical protein